MTERREKALKMLHDRPVAGPDGIDSIYRYLWRSEPGDSTTLPSFHIPHTITLKVHELDCWIYSDAHGVIKRKQKTAVTISAVEEQLLSGIGASGIAAVFIDASTINGMQE